MLVVPLWFKLCAKRGYKCELNNSEIHDINQYFLKLSGIFMRAIKKGWYDSPFKDGAKWPIDQQVNCEGECPAVDKEC